MQAFDCSFEKGKSMICKVICMLTICVSFNIVLSILYIIIVVYMANLKVTITKKTT